MALVTIRNWVGELGNNLEQIANAYWMAQKTNGRFVCEQPHHFLKVPKVVQFGDDLEPMRESSYANTVFLNRKMDPDDERFKSYHKIMQTLSPKLFRGIVPLSFDGLVVHVRAGNIYKDPTRGRYMIQAPLSFFSKAMQTLGIKGEVLVLTKSRHKKDVKRYPSPMVSEIQEYCRKHELRYHVNDDAFEDAIGYLLGAKRAMLTGYTTFSRMLLLANTGLKSIIIPVMDYWPHDEISFNEYGCKVHHFDVADYMKLWLPESVHVQLTHPASKITYRGN